MSVRSSIADEQKVRDLRNDIPFLKNGIYVDNAAVSPLPKSVQSACDQYNSLVVEQLVDAKDTARSFFDKGRRLAAKLVGSSPNRVAYIQNTSHGLSLVALGLDWRPGDNLIVCEQEFPSNYLCWIQLASNGVDVRRISSPNGKLEPDQIRHAIDSRTRVIALSHVQFYSGFRVDISSFAKLCSQNGALLVVDGTQSVGALDLNVESTGIDVLAVSAHKWLMGPRGIGFATFSDRALGQITPRIIGWLSVNDPFEFKRTLDFLPDARRFEPGTPNGSGIFGMTERLVQIDQLGIEWIEERVLALNEMLCERALELGLKPVYQFQRGSRSGITLLQKPGIAASQVQAALKANGVYASVRNGATRIAPHYYNTFDEMERIISVIAS